MLFLGVKEEKNSFLAVSQGAVRAERPDILLVLRIKEQLLSNDRLHCGSAVGSSLWLSYFLSSSHTCVSQTLFLSLLPTSYWFPLVRDTGLKSLLLSGWCFCGRRGSSPADCFTSASAPPGWCACTLQRGLRSESDPTRIDVLQIDGSCCFGSVPEQNVSPPLCSEQNPHFRLFPMSAL